MKTAIRTPIVEAIRSVIQGGGGGPVSPVPLFYWKGQNTLAATTGTDPTFTRATAATFEDFEGLIKTVESQEPRFQGARRVENLVANSQNMSASTWQKTAAGAGVAPVLLSGNTFTCDPGGTTSSDYSGFSSTIPAATGHKIVSRFLVSASREISLRVWPGDAGDTPSQYTVGPTPQLITESYSNVASGGFYWRVYGSLPGVNGLPVDVTMTEVQMEITDGQTNQNPSEYVSTGVATGPELVTNNTASQYTPYGNNTATNGAAGEVILTFVDNTEGPYYGLNTSLGGLSENPPTGATYVLTMDVKVTSGNGVVIRALGGATQNSAGIPPSPSFTTITLTTTVTSISKFYPVGMSTGDVVTIKNVSVKVAEHGANVDGVQYFNTLNANTVTSNVVTEAVGSPLTRANTQFGDLHGVGGDYFSTPNVVTTWPELDIRVRATRDSQNTNMLFGKDGAGQRAFQLYYAASGAFLFYYSEDGSTVLSTTLTSAVPFAVGELGWWRVTLDAATGDIKFFTADGNLEAPAISDYTQQGATQNPAGGATSIAVTTASFLVAAWALNTGTYPYDGSFYRGQVFNEIDGTTPVVDFTPGSYVSGSTFVSSTSGETWTLEGNASIFQPPVDESGPFGYLAEKASTNLVLYSEDFTAGNWLQSVTVQADQATAPDGTLTADKVTGAGSGRLYQAINVLASTDYTFSLWVNSVDMTTFPIQAMNSSGLANILTVDVISSLTVGAFSRVEFSFNTGTATNVRIYIGSTGSLAGWPSGQQAYLWGAQLEKSTYPTSYIPTTTTAVTRNADVLTVAESGAIDYTIGTLSLEASRAHSVDAGNSSIIGTGGFIMYSVTGITDTTNNNSGVTGVSGVSRLNNPVQSAIVWGGSAKDVYHGVATASGSFAAPLTSGDLIVGGGAGGASGMMSRNLKIFNTELTAEEVGDL